MEFLSHDLVRNISVLSRKRTGSKEKKEYNPQIPNPSNNAAPRTYLGLPMPDPTSSESGGNPRVDRLGLPD
jgi:hypothetical protein